MEEEKKNKILIVDDNQDDLKIFGQHLKKAGFIVQTTTDALEVTELLLKDKPDCLLLDSSMPLMSGMELVKKIKTDERLKFIPILMLTGLEDEENIIKGLACGANDYVGKSTKPDIIIARINTLIRVKKLQTDVVEMNGKLQDMNRALENANETKEKNLNLLDGAISQLKELSIRDSLTKLYNHGHFQQTLINEVGRSKRSHQNLSCFMIDIDNFKRINDIYGYMCGDKVVGDVAVVIQNSLRNVDFLARYGGDEFGVLLFDLDYNNALIIATRMREAIEKKEFNTEDGRVLKITISIGIASLFEDGILEADKFLKSADKALLQAKKEGKNQVVMNKDMIDAKGLEQVKIKELETKIENIEGISKRSYMEYIQNLVSALEEKDIYTKEHSINVLRYSIMIAKEMNLPEKDIEIIKNAAILHDIGKICISNKILNKKEKLTDLEFDLIKQHPVIAVQITKKSMYMKKELDIILYHHERFDGKGYPAGLKEKQIPLGARIITVADSYDAMRAARPYREELPIGYVMNELVKNANVQFDADIVFAFFKALEKNGLVPVDVDIEKLLKEVKTKIDLRG